jgi:signal transduction histidine kinase/CheY-like chemotaxis protein
VTETRALTSSGESATGRYAYVIGFLALILGAALALVFHPFVDAKALFVLILAAVAIAAWYGGLLPGLAFTLLAALVSEQILTPEHGSLETDPASITRRFALLLVEGALASILGSQLRKSRPALSAPRSERVARELQPELEILNRLGLTLAGQLDMERLVQAVTDAGVAITGAAYGGFLYRNGTSVAKHYVAGVPSAPFVDFPLFQDPLALGEPFTGVWRSDDLDLDARYGPNLPFRTLPAGHRPARSYLATPVRSGAGELLGGLFFGHPDVGYFHDRDGRLIAGLAAHAAIAVDNAHLYQDAREARASAEAANGLKDEFLATLSHELRTPLTAIVGWADLLHRGKLSVTETARAVDTIIRSASAQNQIIDALLDVSRIITGKLQLDLRPVDVGAILKAAVGTVTPAANAKGIRIQLIQNPAGSYVMGDPERLQQVFWNLLANAIKFTPKDGRVRVSVESVGSNVDVVVADNGLGIQAEFLPRVFDRFTQDDSSSTRQARGLGLGLSIARQLVELHGGGLRAESAGVGQGSTFTATFPRSPFTPPALGAPVCLPGDVPPGLEEGPDIVGIRVLVAEDDDDARGLVAKVLEDQGAIVKPVSNALEALDILSREAFDVLLSDIEMPGMDGYELVKELRTRPPQAGGTIAAAALTAYARTEDRLRALRAGFQLHLAKPVLPAELVTVVYSLAARRDR